MHSGPSPRWNAGEAITLREIWDGRLWTAWPALVVDDRPDRTMLFIPAGSVAKTAVDDDGRMLRIYEDRWSLAEWTTAQSVLSFAWPDRRHAVLALWDGDWAFAGWYVNLETPLGRTARTYDLVDHLLDIVVAPDLSSWRWKDEDELDEAVRRGVFSPQDAIAFREEGERALARLLNREPPFDRDWSSWRPDPTWQTPQLVDGLETLEAR